jgi:hypothetical protein
MSFASKPLSCHLPLKYQWLFSVFSCRCSCFEYCWVLPVGLYPVFELLGVNHLHSPSMPPFLLIPSVPYLSLHGAEPSAAGVQEFDTRIFFENLHAILGILVHPDSKKLTVPMSCTCINHIQRSGLQSR